MNEKENLDNKIDRDETLENMRIEVQKIIDNHLNDDEKFSVMEYDRNELNLLIELLTGLTTREDLEKRHKKNVRDLKMIYEQIVCEYDLINSLKNLSKGTKSELLSLNADFSLETDLDQLNYS